MKSLLSQTLNSLDQGIALCDSETLILLEFNHTFSAWFDNLSSGSKLDAYFDSKILVRIKNAITKKRKYRFSMEITVNSRINHIHFNTQLINFGTDAEHLLIQGVINNSDAVVQKVMDDYSELAERNKRLLEKEKEKAVAANNAKTLFLASMGHELRTPLNGILGMTQKLKRTSLTVSQKRFLNTIRGSGEDLLAIINQVLDFSNIESGKIILNDVETDLTKLINEVIKDCTKHILNSDVIVTATFSDSKLPAVMVDNKRLTQVLRSFVNNAIKFTTQGFVEVNVDLTILDPQLCTVIFTITDSGIGFDETLIEKLFEPFSQIDLSTTKLFGGLGLGLTVSKHLIKIMKGTITVASKLECGSTFTIKFTLPYCEKSTTDLLQADLAGKPNKINKLKDKKVLIVDDSALNREIVKMALEDSKVECLIAEDGQQALEQFSLHQIDIILMDCLMPVMDGFDATKEIRTLEQGAQHIPIIAITASTSEDIDKLCKEAGMDDVMLKPFDFKLLVDKISTCLAKN